MARQYAKILKMLWIKRQMLLIKPAELVEVGPFVYQFNGRHAANRIG